jgi:hypothetical protein
MTIGKGWLAVAGSAAKSELVLAVGKFQARNPARSSQGPRWPRQMTCLPQECATWARASLQAVL